ncbi:tail assembly chaperone [Vibrio phage vB_VpaM_VPs20]|uniref:Tail assembly chaperone n=1 Tax=Vibrio phage vB_VpaM_VPs20 TaxID=2978980 RepID=A0A9X9NZT2_9CAUD|nr:tail assembly chaperone [Vibrio phage vB_VpaM_VPs20]UYD72136.1 tail assembly chaperone [Vibrio phage vB_VpaM_VPs20]
MRKITAARNLQYTSYDKTAIKCEVQCKQFGDKWLPFVMSLEDTEKHGQETYQRAINGEFGEIAEFEPVVLTDEQKAEEIRYQRGHKLAKVDELVMNPLRWVSFTSEEQQTIAEYRQALLDITEQETFPESVEWPDNPTITKDQNNGEV